MEGHLVWVPPRRRRCPPGYRGRAAGAAGATSAALNPAAHLVNGDGAEMERTPEKGEGKIKNNPSTGGHEEMGLRRRAGARAERVIPSVWAGKGSRLPSWRKITKSNEA